VLDEFAMGICLALWVQREQRKLLTGVLVALLVAVAIPVFKIYWANASYWHIDYMFRFWRSSLGLFFGLILAIAVALPVAARPSLPYRAAYYLGELSYGIYLWHLTIILTLKDLFHLQEISLLAGTLALVIPLAALSWHTIEKPLMAYGKKR
jgi:peptidoglycan/LPS O-acetylase OafA/YrhL